VTTELVEAFSRTRRLCKLWRHEMGYLEAAKNQPKPT